MKGSKTAFVFKTQNPMVRLVCAIVFLVFAFSWLYWFQADMLAIAQHGLSRGVTHYDRTVGTTIIITMLMGVQIVVFALTKLANRTHALTYLPSMLLLAFVSCAAYPFSWGAWPWAAPLVLLIWGALVWLARNVYPFDGDRLQRSGLFSRCMWFNMLQMVVMMIGVAMVSNTNAVDHFKARVEVALVQGHVDEALRVGQRSLETDESLTMLRIFALSQKGELAERLFEYAVAGTADDMLPLEGSRSRLVLMPDTMLWNHFGKCPDSLSVHNTKGYLDVLESDTTATLAFRDYRLVGYLIDRQLDSFALRIPSYYTVNDSLPRHYREALALYQQMDSTFTYEDSVMTSRLTDFCSYDSVYPRLRERKIRTEEQFRGTYWYYYFQ